MMVAIFFLVECKKNSNDINSNTTDQIVIDSLIASFYKVKAWDTTTITCYATGSNLDYSWECDHGSFNGEGVKIRYAAGECCVGTNTIICKVSNESGQVSKSVQIEVTSYFNDNE